MLSLGTVAASADVTSDNVGNNDLISLSVYSTLEVDDGNMQNDVNELLLKTNDNETHSSGDVLKVSNNSPLKAGPGGTFNDIQNSINKAKSGDTVYLNGTNYTGNKQISINKDIVIDGASESNSNEVSILDANSASRIFYSSGNYNIVLKNLVFENPILSNNGYCVNVAGGSITIQNVTIRNIKGSTSYNSAIYLVGAGSTLIVSNLTFNNN